MGQEQVIENRAFLLHRFGRFERLGGTYKNCNFAGADLTTARLVGTFIGCNFSDAIFKGSSFVNSIFKRCDFSEAEFDETLFKSAIFEESNFSEALFNEIRGCATCTFKLDCTGMESVKGNVQVLPLPKEEVFRLYVSKQTTAGLLRTPAAQTSSGILIKHRDNTFSLVPNKSSKNSEQLLPKELKKPDKDKKKVVEIDKLPPVSHYRSKPAFTVRPVHKIISPTSAAYMRMGMGGFASIYDGWDDYEWEETETCYPRERWGYASNAILECSDIEKFEETKSSALRK